MTQQIGSVPILRQTIALIESDWVTSTGVNSLIYNSSYLARSCISVWHWNIGLPSSLAPYCVASSRDMNSHVHQCVDVHVSADMCSQLTAFITFK